MKRRSGIGIIEIALSVFALIMLAVVSFGAISKVSSNAGYEQRTVREVLLVARAAAISTGNGATIAFEPRKNAETGAAIGFTAKIYSGRPDARGLGVRVGDTITGQSVITTGANTQTFSVMYSTSGSTSVVPNWVPPTAYPLVGEPVCSGGVPVWIHAKGESPGAIPPASRALLVDCTTGDVPLPARF